MSAKPILVAKQITKRFGGFIANNGIDFALRSNERVGLIGPNGSGKSTLVNCLTGSLDLDGGSIEFDGADISRVQAWRRARLGISRTFQIPRPFKGLSLKQNIQIPLAFVVGHHSLAVMDEEAEQILSQVGLGGRSNASPRNLSQVELRKLELGRALAAKPRVLIADESMAGLSDIEVAEILDLLFRVSSEGIAIVMIEHLMRAVVRFSQRVVVLVAGAKIADGVPQEVLSHPEVVRAYLGE
jgi:branched-chain amino acid transport system ATP-binding protein